MNHTSKLAKNEPSWESVDTVALPEVAFVQNSEYPHHWVREVSLFLHLGALRTAWARANGANGGAPAEPRVLAHLRTHFAALGVRAFAFGGVRYDVTEFDASLLAGGFLRSKDLETDLGAMALRLTGGE